MQKNKTRIQMGRWIYLILAGVFALFVIAQVFFAGLAIFVNPVHWAKHVSFVHFFGFNIPLFLLLFAFIGAFPRWAYWQVLGLLGLIFTMYFTANITTVFPWVGALHPIIAVLLTVLACIHVSKVTKLIFNKNKDQKGEN